jgi:hypothetical protein
MNTTRGREFIRVIVWTTIIIGPSAAQQSANPAVGVFQPDTPGGSHATPDLRINGPSPAGWLFPTTQLNQHLPSWIQFGGQFRDRAEGQAGIYYAPVDDVYNLTQLRLGVYIQPTSWLKLVGVTQDSRVFFNHRVPTDPPYQNIWDIREAFCQIGSSSEGWIDLVAGRQMFSFGGERVIGPSEWINMGRTFDTVRIDIHHPSLMISIFSAAVINAIEGRIDHHIEGNNIHGIYSSFSRLIPHATLEPYLLWRVAPGNVHLPETDRRGNLSEVTGGARIAGTLPHHFDYDVEMNKQAGSLGHFSIDAWAGH